MADCVAAGGISETVGQLVKTMVTVPIGELDIPDVIAAIPPLSMPDAVSFHASTVTGGAGTSEPALLTQFARLAYRLGAHNNTARSLNPTAPERGDTFSMVTAGTVVLRLQAAQPGNLLRFSLLPDEDDPDEEESDVDTDTDAEESKAGSVAPALQAKHLARLQKVTKAVLDVTIKWGDSENLLRLALPQLEAVVGEDWVGNPKKPATQLAEERPQVVTLLSALAHARPEVC